MAIFRYGCHPWILVLTWCPPSIFTNFSWAKSHNFFHNGKIKIHLATLGCQIDEYTRLFGTKVTWRKKQTQRQTKVFTKNPPYSFIWPYSFNWHLRVTQKPREKGSQPWRSFICTLKLPLSYWIIFIHLRTKKAIL